ncbi:MAG: hypothetical protein ACLTY5_04090 [Angelakisella sp.]
MSTISVQTTPSYPILIERVCCEKPARPCCRCTPPCRAALLSDDTVFPFTGAR